MYQYDKLYEKVFEKVCFNKYGMVINFRPLEEKMHSLLEGGELTYNQLEEIADEEIWPFKRFWRWPSREQIETELRGTKNIFTSLPRDEGDVFDSLYSIFKHIELVSIILRFLDPKNYGLYSPPVVKILRLERGGNYREEYLNYLRELRNWQKNFSLPRVADIDMLLWALEEGKAINETLRILHSNFKLKLKPSSEEDYAKKLLESDYLGIAELCLIGAGDYQSGGKWAANAFEGLIMNACKKEGITEVDTWAGKFVHALINKNDKYNKLGKVLIKLKELRNIAVHDPAKLKVDEVEYMIKNIKRLRFSTGVSW
jgi:hypothetical protein